MDVYQRELYMIDSFGQFSEFNFDLKTFKNTVVWSKCMLSGIQTMDKGMLMLYNRAEFFIKSFYQMLSDDKTMVCI